MGRYKTFSEIQVMAAVEGYTAAGDALRVERCERPIGSTVGHVFIRTFVNGAGRTTEQFSRGRLVECDGFFKRCAQKIVAGTPEAAGLTVWDPQRLAAEQPAVVFQEDEIMVLMFKKNPRYEIIKGDRVEATIPATRQWRSEQKAAIAAAQRLLAELPGIRWTEESVIVVA